ncbi:MAG TPA: MarC family protein [Chthoniobacteraceae bacterium]|jgi:multiple antibiotic resistance protein|nr:MarC family protein [Chthoniobacteraceae bacterium]
MTATTLQFGLTAFTTFLVVVDPFGILPIFISLAKGRTKEERARLVTRAVALGWAVSMVFLLGGNRLLDYLGVTVHAFAISGGILLFATALPMLFGQRAPLQSPDDKEGAGGDDIWIFPLAIPLLAGPGTITGILLLTAQARGSMGKMGALVLALTLVFLLTHLVLGVVGGQLVRRLGPESLHVATRVLGIVLAALAVQFVLNGVTGYIRFLDPR